MDDARDRADVWLAAGSDEPQLVVVGLPWSQRSSGMALAPLALRDRLSRFSTSHSERHVDIAQVSVDDLGNWPVTGLEGADLQLYLSSRADDLHPQGITFFLGGDDGISQAIVGATTADLIRFSSRQPVDGDQLAGVRRVTIGAHGFTGVAQRRHVGPDTTIPHGQIAELGMATVIDLALEELAGSEKIHVSIDLDVLDPSFVPGSPDAIPGGLGVRQLAEGVRLCAASARVSSMDLVGADVYLDESGRTLDVGCHLLLSGAMGFRERSMGK